MKIKAGAGELASAFALAASLGDAKTRKIKNLTAIQLVAADDSVKISANILDFQLMLTMPAVVTEPGAVALPGERLAALVGGFPGVAEIEIVADDATARVSSGRSRFKLPVIPQDNLPAPLAIKQETGRIELAREEAAKVFKRTLFASSAERSRFYMGGVLLHDTADGLTAVGTDGYRLSRATTPGAAGLSRDRRLIVPRSAAKIIIKLLGGKNNERIVLRRSETLFAVEATGFNFISKLIDADFPAYERVIPALSGNSITVDRIELMQVVDRLRAVIDPNVQAVPLVGLQWTDEPALHLCLARQPDSAADVVEAEVAGSGKTAIAIHHLAELLAEHEGERICLNSAGPSEPMLVTDPGDGDVLTLQMPSVWSENSQAA